MAAALAAALLAAGAVALPLVRAQAVPSVFSTPAGDYTPSAPPASWEQYCGLSISVAALKDSMASADIDWEVVRAAYRDGDSRYPAWPGVQGYATQEFQGSPYWETNAAYFSDPAWIDTFATANIDGDLSTDDLESRAELLEKTALDQVSSNLIMGLLQAAADGQEGAWDAAAAVWTGCGNDNTHGATRNALYSRSDRRGLQYGTLGGDGTSLTNTQVMKAFRGGYSTENAAVVEQAVQRTAWQSLLRYALFLDDHFQMGSDYLAHQAEAWAFWRILEAVVARVDPERAELITDAMSLQDDAPEPLSPSNYCYILTALEEDITDDAAFGAFEEAADRSCSGETAVQAQQEPEPEPEDNFAEDFFSDFDFSFSSDGSGDDGGSPTSITFGGAGAGGDDEEGGKKKKKKKKTSSPPPPSRGDGGTDSD